ncbi:MAG: hypothetical protein WD555_03880, partial [Fulvivirga sp.]
KIVPIFPSSCLIFLEGQLRRKDEIIQFPLSSKTPGSPPSPRMEPSAYPEQDNPIGFGFFLFP